jgi:hypothetical protein
VTTKDTSWKDAKGKDFFDYTAYVYLTSREQIRPVLESFQGKKNSAVDLERGDLRFPGMATVTATGGFRNALSAARRITRPEIVVTSA